MSCIWIRLAVNRAPGFGAADKAFWADETAIEETLDERSPPG